MVLDWTKMGGFNLGSVDLKDSLIRALVSKKKGGHESTIFLNGKPVVSETLGSLKEAKGWSEALVPQVVESSVLGGFKPGEGIKVLQGEKGFSSSLSNLIPARLFGGYSLAKGPVSYGSGSSTKVSSVINQELPKGGISSSKSILSSTSPLPEPNPDGLGGSYTPFVTPPLPIGSVGPRRKDNITGAYNTFVASRYVEPSGTYVRSPVTISPLYDSQGKPLRNPLQHPLDPNYDIYGGWIGKGSSPSNRNAREPGSVSVPNLNFIPGEVGSGANNSAYEMAKRGYYDSALFGSSSLGLTPEEVLVKVESPIVPGPLPIGGGPNWDTSLPVIPKPPSMQFSPSVNPMSFKSVPPPLIPSSAIQPITQGGGTGFYNSYVSSNYVKPSGVFKDMSSSLPPLYDPVTKFPTRNPLQHPLDSNYDIHGGWIGGGAPPSNYDLVVLNDPASVSRLYPEGRPSVPAIKFIPGPVDTTSALLESKMAREGKFDSALFEGYELPTVVLPSSIATSSASPMPTSVESTIKNITTPEIQPKVVIPPGGAVWSPGSPA